MNCVIFHKNPPPEKSDSLILKTVTDRSALIADCFLDALDFHHRNTQPGRDSFIMLPDAWAVNTNDKHRLLAQYRDSIQFDTERFNRSRNKKWMLLSNGRYLTRLDHKWLEKVVSDSRADVVMVNVDPFMSAFRENLRLTPQGNVVGVRRLYSDVFRSLPMPDHWPHYVYLKSHVISSLCSKEGVPLDFHEFIARCKKMNILTDCIHFAGQVLDLETQEGLLSCLGYWIEQNPSIRRCSHKKNVLQTADSISGENPNGMVRLWGKMVLGKNVKMGSGSVVIGPAIIADDVKIGDGALVMNCLLGKDKNVPENMTLKDTVILNGHDLSLSQKGDQAFSMEQLPKNDFFVQRPKNQTFRVWPRWAYVNSLKRAADVIFSAMIILLFAPVFPFIALAIKINSPGPVFFKDKRQGRWGKEFHCLKFRSMEVHAEKGQEQLRIANQVDGPQFKINQDPRITSVGHFLRDTCIDEIPQFLNVLVGDMSVVGPRPSPASENSLCPYWRDARLSVRPGITGLWQVCRTRSGNQDFQEWIHYDVKYLKIVSLKTDVWICFRTAKKLLNDFVRQF